MAVDQGRAGRPLTLTEQARRAQLIRVTIDLVAAHGYAGTSLARIAEAAEISKAAVLYHFPSKDAVVRAAYGTVIEQLTARVGGAVEPHTGAAALRAYIHSLIAYLRGSPAHARMIIEAISAESGVTDSPNAPSRWQSVAALIDGAKAAGDYRAEPASRITAVIINGAIDAVVAEQLADPGFDSARAAAAIVDLVDRALAVGR
ncbi:TetR/AcrR family transcriptional regulator [Solwaraspora sp. WMMD1047]|uniref:TetR/AcrR family transcriptional regulator n=1 Tax=Solwaraspora sp. WMMD1047 TaxID=3016102 RepID=UPI002415DA3D|nr:TetR/AcrR family transcriptional regulator [Solwaraspora sp. WMMD1047]MDG4829223.1 TetR/AcrR family transcriptional regulator [Solwaraspora sp. WMMD1047]